MTQLDALTDFLRRRVRVDERAVLLPDRPGLQLWTVDRGWTNCGTVEDVTRALLADAEFLALELGNYLATPEGRVIAAAVGTAIPRRFGLAARIVIEGLTRAAELQRQGRWQEVGRVLGLAIVSIAAALWWWNR